MTPSPRRSSTRDRILAAAEDVVLTDGVANLTLEKAAARAGVSKGGVLYHFPTRANLISAMVARLAEQFDAGLEAHLAGQGDAGPGSFARAYVRECFAEPQGEAEQRTEQIGAAVVAAIASESQLLDPLRKAFDGWQERIATDGLDEARATVIRLAADGLWLCELLGFAELRPELRDQVRAELERLASQPSGESR